MEVVERDAAVSVVAEKDEAPMDRVVVAMARVVRAGSWVAEVALEAHPLPRSLFYWAAPRLCMYK